MQIDPEDFKRGFDENDLTGEERMGPDEINQLGAGDLKNELYTGNVKRVEEMLEKAIRMKSGGKSDQRLYDYLTSLLDPIQLALPIGNGKFPVEQIYPMFALLEHAPILAWPFLSGFSAGLEAISAIYSNPGPMVRAVLSQSQQNGMADRIYDRLIGCVDAFEQTHPNTTSSAVIALPLNADNTGGLYEAISNGNLPAEKIYEAFQPISEDPNLSKRFLDELAFGIEVMARKYQNPVPLFRAAIIKSMPRRSRFFNNPAFDQLIACLDRIEPQFRPSTLNPPSDPGFPGGSGGDSFMP